MLLDVDALAQEIRRVDGSHSLGAGQLAEALMPFLGSASQSVGVWPDFIAPAQYENPDKGWEDPALPDFRAIWETARSVGYSVGLHGSMKRDVDLIAAPWTEDAADPQELISKLCERLNASVTGRSIKPLGRIAVSLNVDAWVKPIDLSIAPAIRSALTVQSVGEPVADGFAKYRRSQIAELRPHKDGDDMTRVSISAVGASPHRFGREEAVKLTAAKRKLMVEVADGDDYCNESYRPAVELVKAGFLSWRTENRLALTPVGRAKLEEGRT